MDKSRKIIITVFGHGKTIDTIDKITVNIMDEIDSGDYLADNKNACIYCRMINSLKLSDDNWINAIQVPVNTPFSLIELLPVKFTFNSLIPTLHDLVIQKVIRDVDNRDLAKALKKCDKSVKEKIYKNITKRHRQDIEENRAFYGISNITEIIECQERIMDIIYKLELIGEIVIERTGDEYYE